MDKPWLHLCGCIGHRDGSITWCPTHTAAPRMLEYIAAAVAILSVSGQHNSEERLLDLAIRARAILRDVEG